MFSARLTDVLVPGGPDLPAASRVANSGCKRCGLSQAVACRRMRRGIVIGVVGVLAALVATASTWAAFAPNGPDPVAKEWPAWPYLSQCEDGLPFYGPKVFSGPTEAERGSKPSEVALREFINHGDLPWLRSTRSWRTLAEDEDEAEFARGRLSGELEWASFRSEGGQWKFSSYSSDCKPTSIIGKGRVVTWSLAEPEEPSSTAGVRRIKVHLGPGECASGAPQNPRARFVFRQWGRKLLMTIWLKPLPPLPPDSGHTCLGLIEPPRKVTLPRKIKLSRLYDGSTYPPMPAIERRDRR